MTATETQELQACELQIEVAGKDRLEKALIIGEKLSAIYNKALFRGEGGRTWADWVEKRLPEILPGEAGKSVDWADNRRWLYEVRRCLPEAIGAGMPTSGTHAKALAGLIPRRYETSTVGWNPSELDQTAEGLTAVWELAQRNATQQQRKNGPTEQDVRDARDELRPALLEQGLIREMPKQFQQATADRMAASQAKREQVIDVQAAEHQSAEFDAVMADAKRRAPEVAQQNRVNAVKEELGRGAREHLAELEDYVRKYNSKLNGAVAAIDELLAFLKSLDRTHGTKHLTEMRSIVVAGLLTVDDDVERIKSMGANLMQIAELSTSSNAASGIDMTTLDVEEL